MDKETFEYSKNYTDDRVKELSSSVLSKVNDVILGKAEKSVVASIGSQLEQISINVTNYNSVEEAFLAFPKGNRKIFFPSGNYSFKNIEVKEDTEILLEEGAIVTSPDDAKLSDSFFKISGTPSSPIPNIVLNGGTFDGLNKIGNVIRSEYANDITILNVKANNLGGVALYALNNSIVNIYKNRINGALIGICAYKSENISIKDNYVNNTIQDSILIYFASRNATIHGNKCKNFITKAEQGRGGIQVYFATDTVVTDNFCWCEDGIRNTSRIGIRVRDCERVNVINNNVKDIDHTGIEVIALDDHPTIKTKDVIVSHNQINRVQSYGIVVTIAQMAKNIGKCIVLANDINDVKYISNGQPGAGISVKYSNKAVIAYNTITNTDSCGIAVTNSDYTDISHNTVEKTGLNSKAVNREGIFFSGNDVKCVFNTLIDTQTTPTMTYSIRQYSGSAKIFGNIVNRSNYFQGNLLPIEEPLTSISAAPKYIGQVAVVNKEVYIATGTRDTKDWKQITK